MKRRELIKKLKPYWKEIEEAQGKFWIEIDNIEKKMQKKLGIEDLEIFCVDGEPVGIGNYDRTMKLIFEHDIKKAK